MTSAYLPAPDAPPSPYLPATRPIRLLPSVDDDSSPVRFDEDDLPGIGRRFTFGLADDRQVCVVIHHTGRRDLYVTAGRRRGRPGRLGRGRPRPAPGRRSSPAPTSPPPPCQTGRGRDRRPADRLGHGPGGVGAGRASIADADIRRASRITWPRSSGMTSRSSPRSPTRSSTPRPVRRHGPARGPPRVPRPVHPLSRGPHPGRLRRHLPRRLRRRSPGAALRAAHHPAVHAGGHRPRPQHPRPGALENPDELTLLAAFGLVFLLFTLGLEFSFDDLTSGGTRLLGTAGAYLALNIGAGCSSASPSAGARPRPW